MGPSLPADLNLRQESGSCCSLPARGPGSQPLTRVPNPIERAVTVTPPPELTQPCDLPRQSSPTLIVTVLTRTIRAPPTKTLPPHRHRQGRQRPCSWSPTAAPYRYLGWDVADRRDVCARP